MSWALHKSPCWQSSSAHSRPFWHGLRQPLLICNCCAWGESGRSSPPFFFFSSAWSPLVKPSLGRESPKAHWWKVICSNMASLNLGWEKRALVCAAPIHRVLSEFPLSKWQSRRKATEKLHRLAGQAVLACQPAFSCSRVSARQGEQALCCQVVPATRPMFSSSLFHLRMPTPPPCAIYCQLFSEVVVALPCFH